MIIFCQITYVIYVFEKILRSPVIFLSFAERVLPKSLNTEILIQVFKKDDYLDCNNYRSISLTSNLSILIKKFIHIRLSLFLENNKVIYNHQVGFRSKRSIAHTLIDITEKIRSALDKRIFVCSIYIDLQIAFDTVDHNMLRDKPDYHGIQGISTMWLQGFLTGRN